MVAAQHSPGMASLRQVEPLHPGTIRLIRYQPSCPVTLPPQIDRPQQTRRARKGFLPAVTYRAKRTPISRRHNAPLIRNTFRYAARQYWDEMSRDLRPVYTAPSEAAAKERFVEFSTKWGRQYPAITRLWENAWSEFVPFLDYDVEIRRIICSTNAIESLNARYRRAVRARGHFPTEQAALKCL